MVATTVGAAAASAVAAAASQAAVHEPSLLLLIVTQSMSVVGDAFGQRCSRIRHRHSRRHMIIGLSAVSALQVFLLLGLCQLILPTSITGAIYDKGGRVTPCYQELDYEGKDIDCSDPDADCTPVECPSQGPFSIWRSLWLHPAMLMNSAMAILYYSTEVIIYDEPLALVYLVVAGLLSTFLVPPFDLLFGNPETRPIPWYVIILGMVGGVLCVAERSVPGEEADAADASAAPGSKGLSPNDDTTPLLTGTSRPDHDPSAPLLTQIRAVVHRYIPARVILPFLLLSSSYAIWFAMQVAFNGQYRVNAFGYTAFDQVLLPLIMYSWMWIVDVVPLARRTLNSEQDQQETFLQAVRTTYHEMNWTELFVYRLLINGRAFIYFYLAVLYDLALVYVELTLVRIILAWLGALITCRFFPSFAGISEAERRRTFLPINLAFKLIGTMMIAVCLFVLDK